MLADDLVDGGVSIPGLPREETPGCSPDRPTRRKLKRKPRRIGRYCVFYPAPMPPLITVCLEVRILPGPPRSLALLSVRYRTLGHLSQLRPSLPGGGLQRRPLFLAAKARRHIERVEIAKAAVARVSSFAGKCARSAALLSSTPHRHRRPRVNRRDLRGDRAPPRSYRLSAPKPSQRVHGGVLSTFRRMRAFGLILFDFES